MKKILLITLLSMTSNLFAGSAQWDAAMTSYKDKNWKDAIELFSNIDKNSDEYATAQRYIGYNIYGRELNNWNKAVDHCILAYQANPKDEKVLEDFTRAVANIKSIKMQNERK